MFADFSAGRQFVVFPAFAVVWKDNRKGKLYVVAMEIGVTEGEPYINSENYNEITDRQRKEIKGKMK